VIRVGDGRVGVRVRGLGSVLALIGWVVAPIAGQGQRPGPIATATRLEATYTRITAVADLGPHRGRGRRPVSATLDS
jgi:hypothetical protein